jgi:predicted CopG family antitoxin
MKTINVTFEDKEIEHLEKIKDGSSWRDFILKLAKYEVADE